MSRTPSGGLFNIKSISIINFKGIQRAEIQNLDRINLIFGSNNAGKSTILDAIRLFKLVSTSQLPDLLRRRVIRPNWTSKDIFWDYRTGSTASVVLTSNEEKKIGLKFESEHATGNINVRLTKDGAEIDRPWKFHANLNPIGLGIGFGEAFGNEIAACLNSVELFDSYARENLATIETSHLQTLKRDGLDRNVSEAYGETYREESVSWEPLLYSEKEFRTSVEGTDHRRRFLDGLGDGARAGFLLLATATALKDTYLLVEEIENHQHPAALRELLSQLSSIAESNNLQVFISSHSPDVFRYCGKQENASLQYIQRSLEGVINATSVTASDLTALVDIGWDIGNILKAERFVLVEGADDVEFVSRSIHKIKGYWPHELGITVIPYGGTHNLATVLKALMFPTRKLHVIRDLDSDTEQNVAESIVSTIEQRFKEEGYEVNRIDGNLRISKSNTKQSLELLLANVHGAGDRESLPEIKQHEFEDYLILMRCKSKGIDPKAIKNESSKAALHTMLNSAKVEDIVNVISECTPAEFPEHLTDLVDAITR